VCGRLRAATIHLIDGGDHSFRVPRASGSTTAEVHMELATAIAQWARSLA
jgi:hypothetical protein